MLTTMAAATVAVAVVAAVAAIVAALEGCTFAANLASLALIIALLGHYSCRTVLLVGGIGMSSKQIHLPCCLHRHIGLDRIRKPMEDD